MEFHEKLQELRKQKELTQEDVAKALFVSRTAVSKWESGRGYPNIDSLKAIAAFYGVTVDELLSGNELLCLAQEDTKQRHHRLRDAVFVLLDISVAALLFLPLFGQTADGILQEVSLLSLVAVSPWLRVIYFAVLFVMVAWGILTLALQHCQPAWWVRCKSIVSVVCTALGVMVFIISQQPYAATWLFLLLIIKAFLLFKTR